MDKLIPIGEGQFPVGARDLYYFLEIETRFADWISRRILEYDFKEGSDWVLLKFEKNPLAGRPLQDYQMTLPMAKELSMVERNERGKQARQYFIECERRFQVLARPQCLEDLIILQAQSVKELKIKVDEQGAALQSTQHTLSLVKDTFAARADEWRKAVGEGVKKIAKAQDRFHQLIWADFYRLLEERGHCDLELRLRNKQERMEDQGASHTKVMLTNRMDVIDEDPQLQEIALAIIKEMVAKYATVSTPQAEEG